MVDISDSLCSLFTAEIKEQDGTFVIEIPPSEIKHGALTVGKLPMTEVMGVPPLGVSAHTPRLSRAGYRQAVCRDRTVLCGRRLLPGRGLCPAEVQGYGRPLSNTEALAHTALILGGLLARHRHSTWRERSGVIRPQVQGTPTGAPAPSPFLARVQYH